MGVLPVNAEYIEKFLLLPKTTPKKLAEKLTYYGLETKIVECKNSLIQEIGIILNCSVKSISFPTINERKEKLVEVAINTSDCSEFYLGLIKNIEVKESPDANLVMLESGQPLHIFDYDTLPEKKMIIRSAYSGEKMNALYGQELALNSEDIVVSSRDKVISLAGIIGDQATALTPNTKNILIECATFNPTTIKKTTKHLNVSTAANITSPEDLLEELLRIYDYNKIVNALPDNFPTAIVNHKKEFLKQKRILKTYLTNQGWQEIITYSLISSEMRNEFNYSVSDDFFQLLMPKNEYHEYYRQTLIPSHLKTLKYNLSHGNKDLFFFEISSVYGSPQQQEELLALSGVGVLENIFSLWKIEKEISFTPPSLNYLSFPQSAEIFIGKERIGFFGRLHPQIAQKYQINEAVFIAQISLSRIIDYLNNFSTQISYQPVSNFPSSTKDLSFVFSENINYDKVIKLIREIAGNNLQEIKVFDVYQSAELERTEKKSVSFHLVFQSPIKTLESKEIEKILENIIERVEKVFAAKLRAYTVKFYQFIPSLILGIIGAILVVEIVLAVIVGVALNPLENPLN
ncbi:10380_t:CDS:2 [Funneliformis geosporum]|uniref:10380_t:CDS:1 n=1 Tax=Funneliformis geosporum TaxID=1117311 RepID=A0A9W4WV92_9GLOM|nr:10380_t:CDS:2 [Funneliformis geosporum]